MSRRTEPGTIVTLRRAEPGESTYLAHTSYRAFHSSTVEGWEGWFREHTGVQRGDTVVAEVEGRRAGNATALALTMAPLRGGTSRCGASRGERAAGVSLQRGVADAMMRELSGMRSREALDALRLQARVLPARTGLRASRAAAGHPAATGSRLRTHVTGDGSGRAWTRCARSTSAPGRR
ncbi:MAG: hypothetical protein IPN17_17755 [Deltaproteobacteria bacterium]|nr:hypothetical protein [Deltaproteobacteria bacterium]